MSAKNTCHLTLGREWKECCIVLDWSRSRSIWELAAGEAVKLFSDQHNSAAFLIQFQVQPVALQSQSLLCSVAIPAPLRLFSNVWPWQLTVKHCVLVLPPAAVRNERLWAGCVCWRPQPKGIEKEFLSVSVKCWLYVSHVQSVWSPLLHFIQHEMQVDVYFLGMVL